MALRSAGVLRALAFAAAAAFPAAAAFAAPVAPQLDSQLVLVRYHQALVAMPTPPAVIFTYSVSQAGTQPLEQTHRIYRRGDLVRDETLSSEGQPLKRKPVRIARYPDRYALARLAPRPSDYAFVFQKFVRTSGRAEYVYTAVPTTRGAAYVVDGISIDAASYLPTSIRFSISNGIRQAKGELRYGRSGAYWVALSAQVDAKAAGKPARERIAFSGYRFPSALPASTFRSPKPLPTPVLPAI